MNQREIKFRVWHNNQMYYRWDNKGEIIIMNGGYVILEQNNSLPFYNNHMGLDGAVLMQYTGFKDKNYKEIYEGDILMGGNGYKSQVEF